MSADKEHEENLWLFFFPQIAQQKSFIYLGTILEGSRRRIVKDDAPRLKKRRHDDKRLNWKKFKPCWRT